MYKYTCTVYLNVMCMYTMHNVHVHVPKCNVQIYMYGVPKCNVHVHNAQCTHAACT